MEFEQFEKIMNALRLLDEEIEGLTNAIVQYFDNRLICTIGQATSKDIYEAVEVTLRGKPLAQGGGGDWSDLEWWIYETECGKKNTIVTYPDGTEMDIKTLRNLYDFIINEAKQQPHVVNK